ncbi:MAG: cobalamin biosynthesis protein CobW [Rhodospirillales bacterium]
MKIPATVITGFLGAGKTTLIRHLLENAGGRRIALIINEFGDLGVDADILKGCGADDCAEGGVIELANGCICCTVADDFLPAMESLLARTPAPDCIVIETSGLALPKPLVKAFQWPEIRARVTVDGVVAVVDAPAAAAGTFAAHPEKVAAQRAADPNLDHESPLHEVFEDQLACADIVLLNKTDLLAADDRARLKADIEGGLRAGCAVITAERGRVDPAVLFGLGAGAEDDLAARPSHHDGDDDHDHDDFESFIVEIPELADPAMLSAVDAAAAEIAQRHGAFRLKGFLAVAGKPMRCAVQAVAGRVDRYYDRPWDEDGAEHKPRIGRLVVIGETGMDRRAVTAALQGCAAQARAPAA